MKNILAFFFAPKIFVLCVSAFCLASLAMALMAEHIFDLKPCILCLYQRIPFLLNAVLGLVAFYALLKHKHNMGRFLIALIGVVFIANSALAFYHSGVELKWWVSAFEACTFDPSKIREVAYMPPVPCDEIPWQDPVFSLSMANWNVLICGLAGLISLGLSYQAKARG